MLVERGSGTKATLQLALSTKQHTPAHCHPQISSFVLQRIELPSHGNAVYLFSSSRHRPTH
ncbi:MAG TPA: hypothetical protein ACQGQI_02515 [Xylella sp.]